MAADRFPYIVSEFFQSWICYGHDILLTIEPYRACAALNFLEAREKPYGVKLPSENMLSLLFVVLIHINAM